MRLHRLQLQAFQAFAGREDIDFDALSEAGLFLLHGDTGAGKTTLLDAVCFAIYGKLPGARGSDARIRSDHAEPGTTTEVVLDLTVRGERLRIVRTPEQERPKARGEGTTRARETVQLSRVEADGSETVLATRPDEAGLELTERMGMNRTQFCQVVLLPQGEFATFLRAQSKDRVALLKPIFGAERFEHAEAWLADQAKLAAAERDAAIGTVRQLVARMEQVGDAPAPAEWDEHPETLVGWASAQEDAANRRAEAAGEAEALATRARTEAQDAALDAKALAQRQQRAAAAAAALREHVEQGARREAGQTELRQARAGQGVLPLVETAARAARVAADADRRAVMALAGTGLDAQDPIATDAEALRARAAELDGQIGEVRALEAVERDVAARRAALEAETETAGDLERERDELLGWLAAARDRASERHEELRVAQPAAVAAEQAAHGAWLTLRERRLDGMAAELAGQLEDGEPCAVCGSTTHPAPVTAAESELVTQAQEREAQEVHERARAAREEVDAEVEAARALRQAAMAAAGDATAPKGVRTDDGATPELVDRRRTEVGEHAARIAAARTAIASAEQALTQDEERVEAARAGARTIAERIAGLQGQAERLREAASAQEAAAQARRAAHDARQDAERAAGDAGFDGAEAARAAARPAERIAELEHALSHYDGELVARRQRAEDPELVAAAAEPAPDVAALDTALRAAVDAAERASRLVGVARTAVEQLRALREQLTGLLQELVPVAERAATTRAVAGLAAGSSPQNTKNMSLTTYVLAAWLEQIAEAASVRLGAMTEGRYRLAHTDEGTDGRRKAGLNLTVIDGWTGRERHPSTLSGGETFMASLALALGLADVVTAEAGGNRLETLFVDEGFGTLDEGTLEEVLDVLDRLREGGRVVGIVSHVPELRQRVPAQLHVAKGRAGSHVREVTRGG